MALASDLPSQKCVVCDKDHVVGVDGTERGQSVTHDGEQGDQNIVNDVDYIELSSTNIDPAYIGQR